jgi:hypothetical protein
MTDNLVHDGILGMRWGVRKADSPGPDESRSLKKVGPKRLTDDELRLVISRIQLERQYKDITKKELNAGQKFVSDVLVGAAKTTAQTYATQFMTEAVKKMITKAAVSAVT